MVSGHHHLIDRLIDVRDELAVVLRYSEIDPIARDRIVAAYTTLRQNRWSAA